MRRNPLVLGQRHSVIQISTSMISPHTAKERAQPSPPISNRCLFRLLPTRRVVKPPVREDQIHTRYQEISSQLKNGLRASGLDRSSPDLPVQGLSAGRKTPNFLRKRNGPLRSPGAIPPE